MCGSFFQSLFMAHSATDASSVVTFHWFKTPVFRIAVILLAAFLVVFFIALVQLPESRRRLVTHQEITTPNHTRSRIAPPDRLNQSSRPTPLRLRALLGTRLLLPPTTHRIEPVVPGVLLDDLNIGSALSVRGVWSGGSSSSLPQFPFNYSGSDEPCADPAALGWGTWTPHPRIVQASQR